MSLSDVIIGHINTNGPISFHDFMEMALYYPELGYYTSDSDKIGVQGDYYTSPHFSSIFGEMIARQIEEMWNLAGRGDFTIVEYGAGPGALCYDILRQLKRNDDFYSRLNYVIIEKSDSMRKKERAILHDKVSWASSITDIPEFTGCIISNELLDNFSVHQVVMEDELMEVFVDYNNGFVELLKPASQSLNAYIDQLDINLPKGFRTEINLEAISWINEIAAVLKKGFVLTIDYGNSSSGLYNARRSKGTLLCYNKHRVNDNPYRNIGEQDITAHVNFSALRHWGAIHGLEYCGYTDQANFLHALGIVEYLRKKEQSGKEIFSGIPDKAMLIHTLLMDMGNKFKVLIQHKGIQQPLLSGLKFSEQFV
jgi:SAM-dependent MidA family methyltransferase